MWWKRFFVGISTQWEGFIWKVIGIKTIFYHKWHKLTPKFRMVRSYSFPTFFWIFYSLLQNHKIIFCWGNNSARVWMINLKRREGENFKCYSSDRNDTRTETLSHLLRIHLQQQTSQGCAGHLQLKAEVLFFFFFFKLPESTQNSELFQATISVCLKIYWKSLFSICHQYKIKLGEINKENMQVFPREDLLEET